MCDCGAPSSEFIDYRKGPKKESQLIGMWVVDKRDRMLLIESSIYDSYNDIIGYVTKDMDGNTIRIFENSIKKILE
jgi:hypothetical protein